MHNHNGNGRDSWIGQVAYQVTRFWLRLSEALRFLTILPQPWLPPMSEGGMVIAIPFFPAAGLVIGALLLPVGWVAQLFWTEFVVAALVVAAWGIITGGLHLDGLSDTFDAVMSWRPRERKLEIMKDSQIGAMGALALGAVLLLKVAFLAGAGDAWWQVILLAPIFGRWADCFGIYWFPAAREGGLGRSFNEQVARSDFWIATAATTAAALLIGGIGGLIALLCVAGVAFGLARWWTRDLGRVDGRHLRRPVRDRRGGGPGGIDGGVVRRAARYLRLAPFLLSDY